MMKKIVLSVFTAAALPLAAAADDFIRYEDFGAVGDGIHDDMPAIIAAHEAANKSGKAVKATPGKVYFIDSLAYTAVIKTDTYWDGAEFVINDVGAVEKGKAVFKVMPSENSYMLDGIASLKKGQKNIGASLPRRSLLEVMNAGKKVFIRSGNNATKGSKLKDMIIVDKDGSVDEGTPLIWDFDTVTSVKVFPIDEKKLIISGGTVTTIANRTRGTAYYDRSIRIFRSNVELRNFNHYIKGEGEYGSPYHGFINISNCANVSLENCVLTGHKRYSKTGALKKPTWMGTYDLSFGSSVYVTLRNCVQSNDIDDTDTWGIMGSNFCKNIVYENCVLSRFDAHQGCYGATIRNSVLGGISALGFGTLLIENTVVHDKWFVKFRGDYGSSWDGDVIIRNCTLKAPANASEVEIFHGYNFRKHYFGYDCTLPHNVYIHGFFFDDSAVVSDSYVQPAVFSVFRIAKDVVNPLPYYAPEYIELRGVKVASGRKLIISGSREFFGKTRVSWK